VPAGLEPGAWRFVALFVFVIAALVTEPLPGAAVGVLGVSVGAALNLVESTPAASVRWALSGFSNEVVWLIFSATTFALGYEASGLGRRIALTLVSTLGKRTIGLGYAVALSDLVLAPFMPSNTARSVGTIYPVVRNIPPLYGSSPSENPRAIGAYLFWIAFATTCLTSSMFVTSQAPNLLATEMARTIANVHVTWTSWMIGFLPVGLLLFVLIPIVTYVVYPPTITNASSVSGWAATELRQMGPVSRREMVMAALGVVALVGWIFGSAWMTAVTVALLVVSVMLLAGVVSWNDVLRNTAGWNVLIWFATLLTMANGLGEVGFISWFAHLSASRLSTVPEMMAAIGIISVFFLVHYLFASTSAHTAAVLPAFLAAVVAFGTDRVTPAVVLMVLYPVGIMGVVTPYGTGPAPVWYHAGYIGTREFWMLGLLFGLMYLGALLLVGFPIALRG
jgi:L-tartrate/succinate antiporter